MQLTNMPQNKFKLSTTEGVTRVRYAQPPPLQPARSAGSLSFAFCRVPKQHGSCDAKHLTWPRVWQTFARPVLSVGNSSVVSPTVLGRLRRGGEVKTKAGELIVKYNCIAP